MLVRLFGSQGKKLADSEIIGVYGGKSAFYDQAKVLQHVWLYPDMVDWLEQSDSDLDQVEGSSDVWGYYKMTYTLKDLEKWIKRKLKETHSDRKGKKRATWSQKGKKNDDYEDEDSTSSPKRSHKKSVGGRKQWAYL